MNINNINKTAAYFSSFNPPTIDDFTNIVNLLEKYDNVVVSPLVYYPDKFYRKAISYGKRFNLSKDFLTDFFPKVDNRLVLLDIKSELNLARPRISIESCFNFIQDKISNEIDFYISFEDTQEKDDLLKTSRSISPKVIVSDCNYKKFVRNELKETKHSIIDAVNNVKDYLSPSVCLQMINDNPYKVIKRNLHSPK